MTEPSMTRTDAVERAIRAATHAGHASAAPSIRAQAQLALAWVEIARLLPEPSAQTPVEVALQASASLSAEDARHCGHNIIAWRMGDHWLHPESMLQCDNPPVTE